MMKRVSISDLDILVVDDSELNRHLLQSILQKEGAKVTLAVDGAEAMARVDCDNFDLILIDIDMPGLDGIETTRQIRALATDNAHHIIAITASGTSFDRAMAEKGALFDQVLDRAISNEKLLTTLSREIQSDHNEIRHAAPERAIDMAHALRATGGNQTLLVQLHQMLAKEIREKSVELNQHLEKSEFEAAAKLLHKMQGSAGYCGALIFQQAAQEFESALIENESGYSAESRAKFNRALAELKSFLST